MKDSTFHNHVVGVSGAWRGIGREGTLADAGAQPACVKDRVA